MDLHVESPYRPEALELFEELWFELSAMYGETGPCRFKPVQVDHVGGAFVIAWDGGMPVGCGAIRPFDAGTAELKRMYVRPGARRRGVARAILRELERIAANLGYSAIRLETGDVQPEAIALYTAESYQRIENYGEHAEDPRSRCFEKRVP